MKKINENLIQVKEKIEQLKGKEIKMQVNRGRKKIENYEAVIETIYPSVFTVKIKSPTVIDIMSYSYSEVLCGDVKISLKKFV
jgi:uncharacterized protein Veg